ncbi:MAG: universal stress protein [Chloroflexota bacterium]
MFENILLAIDGSEHARKAARLAGDLARHHDANLRVVVAFEPVPVYLGEPNFQQVVFVRLREADDVLKAALELVGGYSRRTEDRSLGRPTCGGYSQCC